MLNLKKLFAIYLKNEKGFVLVEFVIALPILILLIYTLSQMFLHTRDLSIRQAADYQLENDANEILNRITKDARAAVKVTLAKSAGRQDLIFVFHTIGNSTQLNIIDVQDTRRYILYSKKSNLTSDGYESVYHLYVHRKNVSTPTSPVTGDDISGDTNIKSLNFSIREKNILHISLEIKSVKTQRILKINTSVYMPACKETIGF